MKIGNLNSLHIGLLALLVVAVAVAGVSYSRQMKAERQVAALMGAINTAPDLEQLRSAADSFVAYSGAGTSASAAKWDAYDGCWKGERGSDKGLCIGVEEPGTFSWGWSWLW